MRVLLLILALLPALALAQNEATLLEPVAETTYSEDRFIELSKELRCLVCQNQTLADSDADLAKDMRNEVRKQMDAGLTDQQIIDYLVERYGDFVRYRPPMKSSTVLLWTGPFVLLLIGLIFMFRALRGRRAAEPEDATMESAQTEKLQKLLNERPTAPEDNNK